MSLDKNRGHNQKTLIILFKGFKPTNFVVLLNKRVS